MRQYCEEQAHREEKLGGIEIPIRGRVGDGHRTDYSRGEPKSMEGFGCKN